MPSIGTECLIRQICPTNTSTIPRSCTLVYEWQIAKDMVLFLFEIFQWVRLNILLILFSTLVIFEYLVLLLFDEIMFIDCSNHIFKN